MTTHQPPAFLLRCLQIVVTLGMTAAIAAVLARGPLVAWHLT